MNFPGDHGAYGPGFAHQIEDYGGAAAQAKVEAIVDGHYHEFVVTKSNTDIGRCIHARFALAKDIDHKVDPQTGQHRFGGLVAACETERP